MTMHRLAIIASVICLLTSTPPGYADTALPSAESPLAPVVADGGPVVTVAPNPVPQGDCVFVTVSAAEGAASVECRWLGRSYPCVRLGDAYRAILPVPPETSAATVSVRIVVRDEAGTETEAAAAVIVATRKFKIQHLRMQKSSSKLYDDPASDRERELIHKALARVTPAQMWGGSFIWPCAGEISTPFGAARSINGTISYRHRGLDIAARTGKPVVAAEAGVVTLARGDFKLHGKTIAVDHGCGVGSLYLHLSRIDVKPGQRVVRGQRIGLVGATGAVTGPHLHWGVYVAGVAVEPHFWLSLPAGCR